MENKINMWYILNKLQSLW